MVILKVILGVILTVVYVILMTEIVLGDDSYDKSCDPRGDPSRKMSINVIDKLCSILKSLNAWLCSLEPQPSILYHRGGVRG